MAVQRRRVGRRFRAQNPTWRGLAAAGGRALSTAFRFRGNGGGSGTNRLRSYPRPITVQRDQSTLYRRRGMPRFRRRRWVRFNRKVSAVIQKHVGSKYTVLLRNVAGTSAANKQGQSSIHTILGLNGSSTDTNDVSQLFDAAVNAGFITTKLSGKLMITGVLCETQISNESVGEVWLDCYYWRAKKPLTTAIANMGALWTDALTDLASIAPIGGSTLDPSDYGVTPFQGPQLAKQVRIWRKTRTLLPVGGVVQIETRSAKNYLRSWTFDEDYSMDRITEGVYFVWYGVPTAVNTTADNTAIRFSTNVNYTWKVIEDAQFHGGTNQP